MKLDIELYEKLENRYNVIYPESNNATYTSLLNYSNESGIYRQRWYRYKEGFSAELIKNIIKEYNLNDSGTILDPFLGSGTTIIAANELGLKGVGFEVNPFSAFLSKCKLRNYSKDEVNEFKESYSKIVDKASYIAEEETQTLPKLSIADKVFNSTIQNYFMSIKKLIDEYGGNANVKDLLLLGWLTTLESVSQYRKAGNGLKKKAISKNNIDNTFLVSVMINNNYDIIYSDIRNDKMSFDAKVIEDTALKMAEYIEPESISGVIFSPPYANAFDYTEIYKLELWFGSFVKEYSDLKKLRNISLRSHLNGLSSKTDVNQLDLKTLEELDILIGELSNKVLWDKKIPLMLKLYFSEMFELLDSIYKTLEKNGFCSIVVGNSAYGGVIFPTDLLIARYAEKNGFEVDKIEVDRYIITSSQQYQSTLNQKKYLRESVVCLKKI